MEFNGKTVLVTGGSRGIGKAVALAFGREGANVIVNYRSRHTDADRVVEQIKADGGNAVAIAADVSDYAACEHLVQAAEQAFGHIDILINNSGITRDQLFIRMKPDDFNDVIDVNLRGAFNMVKHVARGMLKRREGRIIMMASVVGLIGNVGQANYAASKAGVIGMTKSLAKEFGKKHVTVNAIAPGFIDTDMTADLPDTVRESYMNQIPLGRLGTAEDVAHAVLFLAHPNAGYITGQIIGVNGGMIG